MPVAMPIWSGPGRTDDFSRLLNERWDLFIIGGGITGSGIALDAASRGLRVALVDKGDFASGTSGKSSKLIHGGLRYLREMQFRTTLESSREKRILKSIAPHLIEDLPFIFPISPGFGQGLMTGTGLWIYDRMASNPGELRHHRMSADETSRALPRFDASKHRGAFVYHDAKADDCRLTLHVLKRAVTFGALALNYVAVEGFEQQGDTVVAARIRDAESGRTGSVAAKVFINAVGVWCDEVRAMHQNVETPLIRPSKGIHIVVPRSRLGHTTAVVIPSPEDRRIIFLIPWGEHTLIGTTDTLYSGRLESARAESADVAYLLGKVNHAFPAVGLTMSDIRSTYAGLRPLLHNTADHPSRASRDHLLVRSPSGVWTITGGKLTTYRRMAVEVVDSAIESFGLAGRPSETDRIDLFAAAPTDDPLNRAYGSEADEIRRQAREDPRLNAPLAEGLPNLLAESVYAVEKERAVHVSDILTRRVRAAVFAEHQGRSAAERVARLLESRMHWNPTREIDRFEEELRLYAPPGR